MIFRSNGEQLNAQNAGPDGVGRAGAPGLEEGETFTTLELKINFMKPVWTGTPRDAKDRLVARAASTGMTLRGDAAAGR